MELKSIEQIALWMPLFSSTAKVDQKNLHRYLGKKQHSSKLLQFLSILTSPLSFLLITKSVYTCENIAANVNYLRIILWYIPQYNDTNQSRVCACYFLVCNMQQPCSVNASLLVGTPFNSSRFNAKSMSVTQMIYA